VLLPGHGAVVVGESVEEASARAVALEDCCRVELAAAQIGAPRPPAGPVGTAGSSDVTFVLWHDLVRGLDLDGE
jgi:ribulose-5-phosphate 4-epimerase/fuculose-1-phosphate aldolase